MIGMKRILFVICIAFMARISVAQVQPAGPFKESIAVTARPSKDSITLRWAPLYSSVWHQANEKGYTITRFTMVRDGKALDQPEKNIIINSLQPLPLDAWEPLVKKNKYAAIAAQALYGDRFELDLKQTDVFSIINKVRENEQRFSFALFSADISSEVAKASALWFTDKKAKHGEKYLYQVSIAGVPIDSLRGSVFTSVDDAYTLPKPFGLAIEFKNQTASLRWNKNAVGIYSAYIVERSADGKTYAPLSDVPSVTLSPTGKQETQYEYAVDSIPDTKVVYSYRVKGFTPFGDTGPPSDVVSGRGTPPVKSPPYIVSGLNLNNKTIMLSWEFDPVSNAGISGFSVERCDKPKGNFSTLEPKLLSPVTRKYEDKSPNQVNYYRITAHGLDNELYESHIYYAQLIDSIPPGIPSGLKATIDGKGKIQLSWTANSDNDIFGYRIYRANSKSEEMSQLTSAPIVQNVFQDSVNIKTLNKYVYYSVMAIDRNQNHSMPSQKLQVALPDIIKPQPPVILPVKNGETGVKLSWMPSASQDVKQYDVYRKADKSEVTVWQKIATLPEVTDSIISYIDKSVENKKVYYYTVVAVDKSNLESDPASAVIGEKIDNQLQAAVQWNQPRILKEKNQAELSWRYDKENVKFFRIYKAEGTNPDILYRSLPGTDTKKLVDLLTPGKHYRYRIVAVFQDERMSAFSSPLEVNY